MVVNTIEVIDGYVSVNGEPLPVRDYVFTANGVEIDPDNLPGWFFAALKSGVVVLDEQALHSATLSLVQT